MTDQTAEWLGIDEFMKRINGQLSRSYVGQLCREQWEAQGVALHMGRRWLVRADALDVIAQKNHEALQAKIAAMTR